MSKTCIARSLKALPTWEGVTLQIAARKVGTNDLVRRYVRFPWEFVEANEPLWTNPTHPVHERVFTDIMEVPVHLPPMVCEYVQQGPVRLYMDIDGKSLVEGEEAHVTITAIVNACTTFLTSRYNCPEDTHPMLATCIRPTKPISAHIVYSNVSTIDPYRMRLLIEEFVETLPPRYRELVDMAVYPGSSRGGAHMRMPRFPKVSKAGDGPVLRPFAEWPASTIAVAPTQRGVVYQVTPRRSSKKKKKTTTAAATQPAVRPQAELRALLGKAVELLVIQYPDTFDVSEVTANVRQDQTIEARLKRLKPSECWVCPATSEDDPEADFHTHDNQDVMLIVRSKRVELRCCAALGEPGTYLGKINDSGVPSASAGGTHERDRHGTVPFNDPWYDSRKWYEHKNNTLPEFMRQLSRPTSYFDAVTAAVKTFAFVCDGSGKLTVNGQQGGVPFTKPAFASAFPVCSEERLFIGNKRLSPFEFLDSIKPIISYTKAELYPIGTGDDDDPVLACGGFNLFIGFHPRVCHLRQEVDVEAFSHITDILYANVFGGNKEYFVWFLKCLAMKVQRPTEILPAAFVRAPKGAAKTTVMGSLITKGLFRGVARVICNPAELTETFTGDLPLNIVLTIDEGIAALANKQTKNALKHLITGGSSRLHRKFKDPTPLERTFMFIIILSNDLPDEVDSDNRRYAYVQGAHTIASDDPRMQQCVMEAKKVDRGDTPLSIRHFFAWLNSVPVEDLDSRSLWRLPSTELQETILGGLSTLREWVMEVARGHLYTLRPDSTLESYIRRLGDPESVDTTGWMVKGWSMYEKYKEWLQHNYQQDAGSIQAFYRELENTGRLVVYRRRGVGHMVSGFRDTLPASEREEAEDDDGSTVSVHVKLSSPGFPLRASFE